VQNSRRQFGDYESNGCKDDYRNQRPLKELAEFDCVVSAKGESGGFMLDFVVAATGITILSAMVIHSQYERRKLLKEVSRL
jgi:hypothetical protein